MLEDTAETIVTILRSLRFLEVVKLASLIGMIVCLICLAFIYFEGLIRKLKEKRTQNSYNQITYNEKECIVENDQKEALLTQSEFIQILKEALRDMLEIIRQKNILQPKDVPTTPRLLSGSQNRTMARNVETLENPLEKRKIATWVIRRNVRKDKSTLENTIENRLETTSTPTKEELANLKKALKIQRGSLQYKESGGKIYLVQYTAQSKRKWQQIGLWEELKHLLNGSINSETLENVRKGLSNT